MAATDLRSYIDHPPLMSEQGGHSADEMATFASPPNPRVPSTPNAAAANRAEWSQLQHQHNRMTSTSLLPHQYDQQQFLQHEGEGGLPGASFACSGLNLPPLLGADSPLPASYTNAATNDIIAVPLYSSQYSSSGGMMASSGGMLRTSSAPSVVLSAMHAQGTGLMNAPIVGPGTERLEFDFDCMDLFRANDSSLVPFSSSQGAAAADASAYVSAMLTANPGMLQSLGTGYGRGHLAESSSFPPLLRPYQALLVPELQGARSSQSTPNLVFTATDTPNDLALAGICTNTTIAPSSAAAVERTAAIANGLCPVAPRATSHKHFASTKRKSDDDLRHDAKRPASSPPAAAFSSLSAAASSAAASSSKKKSSKKRNKKNKSSGAQPSSALKNSKKSPRSPPKASPPATPGTRSRKDRAKVPAFCSGCQTWYSCDERLNHHRNLHCKVFFGWVLGLGSGHICWAQSLTAQHPVPCSRPSLTRKLRSRAPAVAPS